jgi:hypothetical protein
LSDEFCIKVKLETHHLELTICENVLRQR